MGNIQENLSDVRNEMMQIFEHNKIAWNSTIGKKVSEEYQMLKDALLSKSVRSSIYQRQGRLFYLIPKRG